MVSRVSVLNQPKATKMKQFKRKQPESDPESNSDEDDEVSNDESQSDEEQDEGVSDGENEVASDAESDSGDEFVQHKEALTKLKDTDPEFYQFLQENDKKLLQFNLSDAEDEDEEEETHKPAGELEVASDESDYEADPDDADKVKKHGKITLKMLKVWEAQIETDKTNKTITTLTQAFHAALLTVTSDQEEKEHSQYIVEGAAVFNGVIQLCVIHLGPALKRFLKLSDGSRQPPHKCKQFKKIKRPLKDYFSDLSKLLSNVTSSNIQTVLLKHLHYLTAFIVSYPHIAKAITKRLIAIWGTAEEGVRVLAFLCILRITNTQRVKYLDTVLKAMYMTYVKNSKFVSLSTLAQQNFMRRSLVEMFALDANVGYQHVFLYVRQLAIHLRNAIKANKKDNTQAVYNWQFINSLKLWGSLLGATSSKPQFQQLIYPLVQVCLGVIKLVPTAQYYPLRFHVVKILGDLSRDSGVFIPVLPFILEVLEYNFNKKHQKVSMKPVNFTCLLRVSKSQMVENGFKDVLVEQIYAGLLEYLAENSNTVAFPDLSLLVVIQLKQFVKRCTNANYKRKIKQLLEKIEQNNQFIEAERSKITVNITDFKQINGWESQIKNKGTPLSIFYESWNKLHTLKKNKQLTDNEKLGEYNLPTLKKRDKKRKTDDDDEEDGPVVLFPSDDEDSDLEIEKKKRRGKRAGKNQKKQKVRDESGPVEDGGERDIVEELDVEDW